MSKQEYEFHPYAAVLPMLGQAELNELAADIQGNGLREDIVLFDGKILDGRNRYRACGIVGVEPRFRELNGEGDPIDFIISVNVRRRHLTGSQKALVISKIDQLPRGNPQLAKSSKNPINPKCEVTSHLETSAPKTASALAAEIGVSRRTLVDANRVLREAPKETVAEVERGEKSVSTAVKEIKQTKAEKEAKAEVHLDKTGYPIPETILEDWQRAEAFRSTLADVQRIKLLVEKGVETGDLIFREIGQDTTAELKNIWSALKSVLPYSVCPACQGRARSKCTACKRRGFVSEFGYKHWFAKEVIEIRERSIKK